MTVAELASAAIRAPGFSPADHLLALYKLITWSRLRILSSLRWMSISNDVNSFGHEASKNMIYCDFTTLIRDLIPVPMSVVLHFYIGLMIIYGEFYILTVNKINNCHVS